jgi:hypothetical protein
MPLKTPRCPPKRMAGQPRYSRPAGERSRILAVGLVLLAALLGCGGGQSQQAVSPAPATTSPGVDWRAEVRDLYEQTTSDMQATEDYQDSAQALDAFGRAVDRLPVPPDEELDRQRLVAAAEQARSVYAEAAAQTNNYDRLNVGVNAIRARDELTELVQGLQQ